MAEVAALGLAANIIQLVAFGTQLCGRLQEYQGLVDELPECYTQIQTELPLLLNALDQIKHTLTHRPSIEQAVNPVIQGCRSQVEDLGRILDRLLPSSKDTFLSRGRKAISSLLSNVKVERIRRSIGDYVQALTFHNTSALVSVDVAAMKSTPASTNPFRRDPHFVARTESTQLLSRSRVPASRTALVGLGGTGKSQIAIELAHVTREQSPTTWVFWVHASNAATFIEGCRQAGAKAKFPGWNSSGADIVRSFRNWLCDEGNGSWLLVLDNLDDPQSLNELSNASPALDSESSTGCSSFIRDFCPQTSSGSILLTSRSRQAALEVTGDVSDIIQISAMTEVEACALLSSKLADAFQGDEALVLTRDLGHLPLALTQAAAYIRQRWPRMSIKRYIEALQKNESERVRLLAIEHNDIRRPPDASNSVLATLQLSIAYLNGYRPSAVSLLSLLCFFDMRRIPEELLSGRYHVGRASVDDFEEDLNELLNFSLVTPELEGKYLEVHPLVQGATRSWLDARGESQAWFERYLSLLDDAMPVGHIERWGAGRTLLPHTRSALSRPSMKTDFEIKRASILIKASWTADEMGSYGMASTMGEAALRIREKLLGPHHPDSMTCKSNLAFVVRNQGDYPRAEVMLSEVLAMRREVLGEKHLDTLTTMHVLATVLRARGKYLEAEGLNSFVLAARLESLGAEHIHTLASKSNLAYVWRELGQYDQAERTDREVLATKERTLGVEHPETLNSLGGLASTLQCQGKLVEAKDLGIRHLALVEDILGHHHPLTLTSAKNLALALQELGELSEAEALNLRALEGKEQDLGLSHPSTLTTVHNLAIVLYRQGRYAEAVALNARALEGRIESLGSRHPEAAKTRHNLALATRAQKLLSEGRNSEAVALSPELLHGLSAVNKVGQDGVKL